MQTKYYDQSGQEIPHEQVAAEFTKQVLEFQRYKQDCRKRALEVAERTVTQSSGGVISEKITNEADKYYDWLINIPQ